MDSATASKAEAAGGGPGRRLLPGSISRRILWLASAWIAALLLLGGVALDRIVSRTLIRQFDEQVAQALPAMLAAAEVDPLGEIRFNRPPVEPRYSEPYSGAYWQVSAEGHADFRSRSLWDRELPHDPSRSCLRPCAETLDLSPSERVRVIARDARLPGSDVVWRFKVAQSTETLDDQLARVRLTLWLALGALGLGLFALAALQATVGLLPLRRLQGLVAAVRSGHLARLPAAEVPPEVAPLAGEVNQLLEQAERSAEEARRHAGNLAHALKTPIAVLMNEAAADSPDLADSVRRELSTMRAHVDHHLARARAMGAVALPGARADVWPALERLRRTVTAISGGRAVIDLAGERGLAVRGQAQDLEEMLGNLLDNAAKYGGGRIFVTVGATGPAGWPMVEVLVEDDGPGIPADEREPLFARGARLDRAGPTASAREGAGLGLAIVRDLVKIHGGTVALEESEELGGLQVRLRLPRAPAAAPPRRPA